MLVQHGVQLFCAEKLLRGGGVKCLAHNARILLIPQPGAYRNYGADIFRYTVLKDKSEVEGLTRREKKEYAFLEKLIPQKSLADWLGRRAKNFDANKRLIDLTRANDFNYFVLGRDDNAP